MADRIENRKKTVDKRQMLLVALCWAIYTASYLGKYCYSANISVIRSYFAVDKATAGLVGTCFFFFFFAGAGYKRNILQEISRLFRCVGSVACVGVLQCHNGVLR